MRISEPFRARLRSQPFAWARSLLAAALLVLGAAAPAWAHRGPPFPILQHHKVGPLDVSIWSNPDVGNGLFYVLIRPPKGGAVPDDLTVRIAVQPLSGRLPERAYKAVFMRGHNPAEYRAVVPFDKVEMWHVRALLESPQISGEADVNVRTMPAGLGRWDLALWVLPFVGIALLWLRAVAARQKRRRKVLAAAGSPGSPVPKMKGPKPADSLRE